MALLAPMGDTGLNGSAHKRGMLSQAVMYAVKTYYANPTLYLGAASIWIVLNHILIRLHPVMSSVQGDPSSNAIETASGCPFHTDRWEARPNADQIPCPALLSFYNNGWLNPDDSGNLIIEQLDAALVHVGISAKVRSKLVKGADGTDAVPDSFNLFALKDSKLDHSGSTGVRDPEISPEKLQSALLRFSENGRMYAEHFAAAANQAAKLDPGAGTIIETVEFRALLEVFGRLDENGQRYVSNQDVKDLWLDGRFPKDWQPRPENDIGTDDVLKGVAIIAIHRLLQNLGIGK
jgi:hypothetical protein